jgi:hypothetical protein
MKGAGQTGEKTVVSTDLATLVKLDIAALVAWGKERLEAAGTELEVRKVKADAKALEAYARAMKAGKEAQQAAVEITLRAERKLQQQLKRTKRNRGGRPRKTPSETDEVSEPTLAQIGVSQPRSSENAVLAEVTPEQFEAGITALRERGELTQGAMRNLMGQAMAGGLSPVEIEDSIKAEKARQPEPPPAAAPRLKIDLSPVATAISDLDVNDLWRFDPTACAATVVPVVRDHVLDRARFCRAWLDKFITAVEEKERAETQGGEPGREAA